jgi:hypothetical protein
MRITLCSSRILILPFLALLVVGCASTRTSAVDRAAGTWQYTVFQTPEGDVDGLITLRVVGGELAGELSASVLREPVPLEHLGLEDGTLTFLARFNIDGQPMSARSNLTLASKALEGSITVEGVGTYRVAGTKSS